MRIDPFTGHPYRPDPEADRPTIYHFTKYYYLGGGMHAELERIRTLYIDGKMSIEEFTARLDALNDAEKRLSDDAVQ